MSTPSRTAILKTLRQHEKSLPEFDSEPVKPSLSAVSPSSAMSGLKSGQYVLLNRNMLRAIIKELSK